ncbi:MAG: DUF3604 domain-containing protein [Methyloceanibacter sp.]
MIEPLWTDPDFDASERAFYFVRFLEISTPNRAYDSNSLVKCRRIHTDCRISPAMQ